MTNKFRALILVVFLLFTQQTRADVWGGDVVVLTQILANALQQLIQLKSILQNGQDSFQLMQDINRGINDSLGLMRTISPNSDPGIYKDWTKLSDSLRQVEQIYGHISPSGEYQVQKDTDQQVAEAVNFNNSVYDYTKEIDELGETIKRQSHEVSPGGASKLTVQTLGVMLHVQNEGLRAQATGLKLQAQAMAIQNRKDKLLAKNVIESSDLLRSALSSQKPQFNLPRF